MTDHYRTLQVRRDAPSEVISAAYRRLMRDAHPDRGGDTEYAKRLNLAHDTLSDPEARRTYDLTLQYETVRSPSLAPVTDDLARRLGIALGGGIVKIRRVMREVRNDLSL